MSSKCACNCGGKMKHQKGGQINNKKSNNMKENLGSIQSILDSFKKGGCVKKKQDGGDLSPKALTVKQKGGKAHKELNQNLLLFILLLLQPVNCQRWIHNQVPILLLKNLS